MPFAEPSMNENDNPAYVAVFHSEAIESGSEDPAVTVTVTVDMWGGGEFMGDGSDALFQDLFDRLEASPLLRPGAGVKTWEAQRVLTQGSDGSPSGDSPPDESV